MAQDSKNLTYRMAGVDIEAGNALVDAIRPHTTRTKRKGVMGSIGGFGALFDLKAAGYSDPILVAATDGVGTKLRIAIESDRLERIGIDLVAMCVNDLICQGAEPLFFLDYFATGALSSVHAEQVISGIAEGCQIAGAALIGGETAEMPGFYAKGDFDLAGFSVGAMERGRELPREIHKGDQLIGLPSSGPHSNGYSLIRKIVERSGLRWSSPSPFSDESLGEALLTPTRIYISSLLPEIHSDRIKGLAHITGGGLTENIPRILPAGLSVSLNQSSWQMPEVFDWLQQIGKIEDAEMRRSFNCGIGMVLVVAEADVDAVMESLKSSGEMPHLIGQVISGEDVVYRD